MKAKHGCCPTCRWFHHSDPLTRKDCPRCTGEGDRIDKGHYYEPNWEIVSKQYEKAKDKK